MAGGKAKTLKVERKPQKWVDLNMNIQKYCSISFVKEFLTNPKHVMSVGWLLLTIEFVLNVLIVWNVPYTEIDWKAYMQEVEGFINGTLDYTQLKGDTGPLVYPAGFVYLYSGLYYITNYGENIRLAQYIFICLYLSQLFLTLKLYAKTRKIPPYAIILTTLTSYRVHSIYSLRLFNDTWAVLLFFISVHLFLGEFWTLGSIFYSLAVSIKMNILLYAPCLLLAYIANGGIVGAVKNIFICGFVQVILGAPFLYGNFWGYLKGSFDLGRIFEHKWTVNFRFLNREIFENRIFHLSLLSLHIFVLLLFLPHIWRYLTSYTKLKQIENQLKPQLDNKSKNKQTKVKNNSKFNKNEQKFLDAFESGLKQQQEIKEQQYTIDFSTSAQLFVLPFFVTNLIGVACARSLHYQFYIWYFHGLLYLGWCTRLSQMTVFLLLGILEACWNTYPSTVLSSGALHVCHLFLLIGVYRNMKQSAMKSK